MIRNLDAAIFARKLSTLLSLIIVALGKGGGESGLTKRN